MEEINNLGIDDENFENFFKYTDKINPLTIPKDFKDFFKNAETITEIPPFPKDLDTKHLQEFIDEIDDIDKHNKQVTMRDMYGITYEEIVEAREKHGWNVVDMFLEEPKDSDIK